MTEFISSFVICFFNICIVSTCSSPYTEYGSTCYRLFSSAKSWAEAEVQCQMQGGHLAAATDTNTLDVLFALIKDVPVNELWVGARLKTNIWQWVPGT